jgi:hypothetical protein
MLALKWVRFVLLNFAHLVWGLSDVLALPLHCRIAMSSDEIFGPAVGITRFSTDAEAIRIVNKLEYGLSGAVHSRDVTRAAKVAQQLEINLVHINSFTLHDNPVRFLLTPQFPVAHVTHIPR